MTTQASLLTVDEQIRPQSHEIERFSLKFYLDRPAGFDPESLIPVFHRWIQQRQLEGLLIDVADYTHVHHGPGLMIVAHEGHYRLDESDGRLGLEWSAKRAQPGSLEDRLLDGFRKVLLACQSLENERELGRDFLFPSGECRFRVLDKLRGPNQTQTFLELKPVLEAVLGRLYEGADVRFEMEPESRECFGVKIQINTTDRVGQVLSRVVRRT